MFVYLLYAFRQELKEKESSLSEILRRIQALIKKRGEAVGKIEEGQISVSFLPETSANQMEFR